MNTSEVQTQNKQNTQTCDLSASRNAQSKTPAEEALSQRYQIIREIGHGTQAKVYEAKRLADDQRVAIKELRIDSLPNWKAYDLFWREVETLKSLNIKGVAKFYEVIEQLDSPQPCAYLVQQYISGKSLSEMIRSGYRFDIPTVFKIAVQLVDILKALHHHEPAIIHRDIKPSNIVIEQDDDQLNVYLIDFGAVANPLLQKGGSTVAGTYGYMPPEQLMGKPVTASDIYALGATLAGLLSGMEPSDMDVVDYRLAIEKPLENLPYPIVSCLREMIQSKVEDRLCDYDILKHRFEQFEAGEFTITTGEKALNKTNKQYIQMLQQIHALGLRENYDLWSALPEATPREVPSCYKWRVMAKRNRKPFTFFNILNSLPLPPGAIPLRFEPALFIRFPIYTILTIVLNLALIAIIAGLFYVALFFGYILILAILDGITNGWIDANSYVRNNRVLVYTFFLLLLIFPFAWHQLFFCNKTQKHKKKSYMSLLQNGRKTLATIQSVQYVGVTSTGVTSTSLKGYFLADGLLLRLFKNSLYTYAYYNYYSQDYPMIRVTYAFNSPDNSSVNDIVHSVLVPAVSEKYLKEGDLLPILYEVDPSDTTRVSSMPFPLPISPTMKIKDMVFISDNSQGKDNEGKAND